MIRAIGEIPIRQVDKGKAGRICSSKQGGQGSLPQVTFEGVSHVDMEG